jgi:hypothetical protein
VLLLWHPPPPVSPVFARFVPANLLFASSHGDESYQETRRKTSRLPALHELIPIQRYTYSYSFSAFSFYKTPAAESAMLLHMTELHAQVKMVSKSYRKPHLLPLLCISLPLSIPFTFPISSYRCENPTRLRLVTSPSGLVFSVLVFLCALFSFQSSFCGHPDSILFFMSKIKSVYYSITKLLSINPSSDRIK